MTHKKCNIVAPVAQSPEVSLNVGQTDTNDRVQLECESSIDTDGNESGVSSDGESCDEIDISSTGIRLLGDMMATDDKSRVHRKARKKRKHVKSEDKLADLRKEEINRRRNENGIHVYGTDIPSPLRSFDELLTSHGVHSRIIDNIRAVGYDVPTPIQMQTMTVMLQRRDLMACAPTGSGKTAAFILPILHQLEGPRNGGVRAVVLAPTRELAKQTYQWFVRLGEGRGFRIHVESAGAKIAHKSFKKFDILVSTPNRLVYMLKQEPSVISLQNVEWLVVDESDKLFEEGRTGFRDQLAVIYKACDGGAVRRALFSATFACDVEQWCKLNLDNVVQVYIGTRNMACSSISQELLYVGAESGKLLAVRDIIRKGLRPPVLIFVQSKERAKELFSELIYDGINTDVIHSDRTQLQRDNVVKCFRSGQVWVLICTELMGRGIDFQGVNLVINYDFPTSSISYIHRIGRTGRAGKHGRAVTFFTEDDKANLRSIANVMKEAGCPVPDYMLHIKRPNKKVRRQLAKQEIKRDNITTVPQRELDRQRNVREMVQKKRRRKKQQLADNVHTQKKRFTVS